MLIAALVFSLSASVASAAFSDSSWQYYRAISIPSVSEFVKITLPETASRTSSNFSDIRIITQNGVEVPYFLTKNAVLRGGENRGRILNHTTQGGVTSFIVDTGAEGVVHTGIQLDSNVSNFKRQVKISAATTLLPVNDSGWSEVTDTGFIFKFTDPYTGFSSGKNDVDFPANTSRYLKVVIEEGTEGALTVSGASIYSDRSIDIPSYKKSVPISVFNNPTRKTTEVTVDLGESGHMTDAITLHSTDRNYSRRVVIETSHILGTTTAWTYVGEGSISNITTALFSGASDRVTYPEQKARYIRVSIVNDDNRPLTLGTMAQIEGPIVSAIFETRANESYRLYYGNSSARVPTYDIARISSYIETNALPAGTLGEEVVNPAYIAPAAPAVPFTEAYPWVFNTMLVIVVILLGGGIAWYLSQYMKKQKGPGGFVETMPQEEEKSE